MTRIIFVVAAALAVSAVVFAAPAKRQDSSEFVQSGSASFPVQVANSSAGNEANADGLTGTASVNLGSQADSGTNEWAAALSQDLCSNCGENHFSLSEGEANGYADSLSQVAASADGHDPHVSGSSQSASNVGGVVIDTGSSQ